MEKLLNAIEQEMPYHPDTDYEIGYHNGMTMAKAIVLKMDVKSVVHGRWKNGTCTNCGQVDFSKPNYCPNCGAKMDLEG